MLFLDLGQVPYDPIWQLQHRLVEARLAGSLDDCVLLLEHEPVITLGRSADERHVLATQEALDSMGISVHRVERGGGVTYHGPGQLIGYPILRLQDHQLGVAAYMHTLEQVLIDTLATFGCTAFRHDGSIGVWTSRGKIAALGARIQRGVTYHGFALNVDPCLDHYQLIVACGMKDAPVTSLLHTTGQRTPMATVRDRVIAEMGRHFDRPMVEANWDKLHSSLGIEALDDRATNSILPEVPAEARGL